MKAYRWHEQDSLQNLYKTELDVLKNGLGGDFVLKDLIGLDITQGVVTVTGLLKYGENKEQGVLIVFPTKYPYYSPKIISVDITEKEGKPAISVHFFGKGNQYSDGEMCLFRKNVWDRNKHNIGWMLRKAQKWLLSATSAEGFKPEEIVDEVPMYMSHSGQVLIPSDFDPKPNERSGQVTLTQFKPNHYILTKNVLSSEPFKLSLGDEVFNWFALPSGITFKEVLPAPTTEHLINLFKNYFGSNILNKSGLVNIALYVPDDQMKWHFFKIQVQAIGAQVVMGGVVYYISRIISNELYLRTKDVFSNHILEQKRVTIIGLGALGSEVARSLARNGVGTFHLFDNDIFEIGNSIRHAADLYFIGEGKTEVAKQLIHRTNPNIIVNSYPVDVLQDNGMLELSLENSDLCIVLTGEDAADYMINDLYASSHDIPFVFAGVSIGGMSGSIQVVSKNTACLRCLSLMNVDTLPKPKNKVQLSELPPEYGNCSSPALPGSEIDIKEVALQVSRVSLQLLLAGGLNGYPENYGSLLKWHGPMGSKEQEPFTWEIKRIEKCTDCEICNK